MIRMYILSIFTKITSIVESYYNKKRDISRGMDILIQLVYSMIISTIAGIILHIFTMIMLGTLANISYINDSSISIFIIPEFIFTMCIWIILYNYHNEQFRFSQYMFKIYLLSTYIKTKVSLTKSIIFLIIMPIILSFFPTLLLMTTDIDKNKIGVLYTIILIITFIISLILYSEFQVNVVERSKSQVFIWGVVFLVILSLNIYQYTYILSSNNLDYQTIVNMLLSVGGLAFTVITMADKTREMFKHLNESYGKEVDVKIKVYLSQNNYNNIKNNIISEVSIVEKYKNLQKYKWKKGKRKEVIHSIGIVLGIPLGIIILMFNMNFIKEWILKLGDKCKEIYIQLFNGDAELAEISLITVIILAALIYVCYNFIRKLKSSSNVENIRQINLIILILMVFIIIFSNIF